VAIPSALSERRKVNPDDLTTRPPKPDSPGRAPSVLQVVPALEVGGVERGTVEVAAALAEAGWNAVVVSAGGRLVREIERVGARHIVLPLAAKNPLAIAVNARRLAALITREEIDLVHARSRAPAWSALIAAHHTGRPFVTTFHNAYGAGSWPKRRYNSVMARGDRVIAISRFVADHAAATYGVPKERLRIIERGVDLDYFDAARVGADRLAELARAWRLDEGGPVVMLPGRLTSWKGHGILIEALDRLGRRDLRCLFVGGGGGRYREALERRIAALGLAGICRFVDHAADMPAAYLLADVVVSASTRPEGFGRVIVEALAMGRPVIATDHGGAREILGDRDIGWLIPPGDVAALALALGEVLALDPALRAAQAHRGLAVVRGRFSRARMTDLTLSVYREVLGMEPMEPARLGPAP
jgi:glycosyltransferase involved in cell wall biosynthesis